ncbi:MAG: dethiobiotin synthase [Cenarchaeum sp. SB0665_bin_23]|nr:dethiobiotin synthase [Cenarchaeum sp. SB0667_bin_13]MXY37349.1 dethiobiotin synthase [Cenarchaeum sp. SB0664_bin_35]MXY61054.1 dethiobiotin synthase [Cenarchaeum sp. SB0665_bin_23]MXZ94270.1 dethiobiotin synthase [Cenarchaeum sp. SB0666_bin_15]MYB46827.1 dethiobiotin synthase [Cenarchaeum sp. SB0662_bin_33]MYC79304.1 dethiobiotin synthase [Cenarchaeum sp. SB0661_bin_35]MYD58568.1 dethiobiotin synthase [Cenarchaeum sp. SB0678_bin_8]MYG33067.1 dethiobiotin synthase [Cenarchaeum sp. SB0677_
MKKSVFILGTDTGIGKTYVAVRIIRHMREAGICVGVMKPYSAGKSANSGAKSEDAHALARAAGVTPNPNINPDHQEMEASPYTRCVMGHVPPDPQDMIRQYKVLESRFDVMVVEGMGGCMVPILHDYYMADLARDMGLPAIMVSDNRIGAVNHCIMSVYMCRCRDVRLDGIILNIMHTDGYDMDVLQNSIEGVLDIPVIGTIQNGKLVMNQSVATPK